MAKKWQRWPRWPIRWPKMANGKLQLITQKISQKAKNKKAKKVAYRILGRQLLVLLNIRYFAKVFKPLSFGIFDLLLIRHKSDNPL